MKPGRIAFLMLALFAVWLGYTNCGKTPGSGGSVHQDSTSVGNPLTVAALPQVFLVSSYPQLPANHKILTVGTTGRLYKNCQAAIDAAAAGDEVVIDAGFVCTPIVLKNKGTLQDYIVIRTANLAQLPAEGTRVTHNDAPNMAVIQTTGSTPPVSTEAMAHHYQLVGLEIRFSPALANGPNKLVQLGSGNETSLSDLPHDIVIARSWIHAAANQEISFGIMMNASAISIVDSVIDDIHSHTSYARAIAGYNTGVGPFKIVNNRIEAAGAAFNTGGSAMSIPNLISTDIELRDNYIYKPLAWKNSVTSNENLTGPWVASVSISLTNAQRVLISGNTIENNWAQTLAGYGGTGAAIRIQPSAYGSGTPGSGFSWVRVQDITFTNNIIRNTAALATIGYEDPSDTLAIAQRLDFTNNVAYGIQSGGAGFVQLSEQGHGATRFDHNTILGTTTAGAELINAASGGSFPGWIFTNNITFDNGKGFNSALGAGAATIQSMFPSIVLSKNVLTGCASASYGSFATGNFFPASLGNVGFIADPSGGVSDYHTLALTPGSPYHNASLDGSDIGVNITALDNALK